jgi:hypothetical protein
MYILISLTQKIFHCIKYLENYVYIWSIHNFHLVLAKTGMIR